MDDLVNKLIWSFSRREMFESCRRRYYYHYYLSWGGWDCYASKRAKSAYRLKKIQNMDAYVGSQVHDQISRLAGYLSEGKRIDPDESGMLQKLDWAFQSSRANQWRQDIKRYPKFWDDYYGKGISSEREEELKQKMVTCLHAFIASPMYARMIQYADQIEWLWIDNPLSKFIPTFTINDFEVYSKLDLAIRLAEKVYIFDFKTGKPTNTEADQIISYSLFALERWKLEPERISAQVIGLHPKFTPRAYPVTPDSLNMVSSVIRTSYAEMRSLVDTNNCAREEDFSKTSNGSSCRHCNFLELCQR